jgi:galactonate dehydratase
MPTGSGSTRKWRARRPRRAWPKGWTAVKFDPAGPYTIRGGHMPGRRDIGLSAAFCEDIRAAVGDAADLLFGTHGQFIPGGAIRLAKAIEPSDPLWFEEPVPPDNFPALAEVARATSIPVATGERLTTKAEFAAALAHGARILQPALGRAGGIWEAKKIAILAEAAGAQMAPHLYAGPVEWAANVHLAVSCPNILMVEAIESAVPRGAGDGAPEGGKRFRRRAECAGAGDRTERRRCGGPSRSQRTGCTWRCRRRPATGRTGTISPVGPPTEDRMIRLRSFAAFFFQVFCVFGER